MKNFIVGSPEWKRDIQKGEPALEYIIHYLYDRVMHALDVLGDPVRRRILELLADEDRTAGAIAATIGDEFGISQPAVSQHLRVLRERGFVVVRAKGRTRTYSVRLNALAEGAAWFRRFQLEQPNLDALATEIARGKRQRRIAGEQARRDGQPDDVRKDPA